ncbi:hypothetical protein CKAH01_18428 [Colletotrichum kahawae]|uniref:Uncharacterized protein n=1 Tax=Colletotrichum kahawae TaxID=34407 RepID=A0AAD9Y883_COLKA|nr:hypothetical protein CKAH01_18428 [Colletotrichum kahawae]
MDMFQFALQVIRKRYPLAFSQDLGQLVSEYPPREAFKQTEMPLQVTGDWVDYMNTVAISMNTAEQGVSSSLWHLARGDLVDNDIVTNYVQLLRSSYPDSQLLDPVTAASDALEAAARLCDMSDAATLIPCNLDGTWFVAVAYADCIQLYGVQVEDITKLEQQFQASFRRPTIRISEPLATKQPEDTVILTLLSLRILAGGGVPVVSAETAFLQKSRARIFIELLTDSPDAKDSDVSNRLKEAQVENSVFFDEAFIDEEDTLSPVGSTFTADMQDGGDFASGFSPESFRSPPSAREISHSAGRDPGVNDSASAEASHHPSSSSRPTGPGPACKKFTSLRSGRVLDMGTYGLPPSMPRECRTILDTLSEAVAFYRNSRLSESSELAVIWSAIKSGARSEFYRRYSGVLFHKEMARLSSDQDVALCLKTSITMAEVREMRRLQSEFQIWHDICQLRRDWGPGQYALLCVLPEKPRLEQANQDLSEPEFTAYTSLDPRPVIPISRWGPRYCSTNQRCLRSGQDFEAGMVQ